MITDIAQDSNNDFELTLDTNGFMTISLECNHPVVSNLVRTVLEQEVDWESMYDDNISTATRAQLIRGVLINIEGVTDVDMSGFNPQIANGFASYGVICPTIDCDNSRECVTI